MNTLEILAALVLAATAGCAGPQGDKGDPGAPGEPGSDCTVKAGTEAGTYLIECADGTKVTVSDGAKGADGTDATPCSIADNGDGTKTISCPDGTSATVSDGKAGDNASCTVTPNADGSSTVTCADGSSVVVRNGEGGDPGRSCTVIQIDPYTKQIRCDDGTNVTIKDGALGGGGDDITILGKHGRASLAQQALITAGKYYAKATITAATADAAGVVTVNFNVKDANNAPLLALKGFYFNIASLQPAGANEASNRWVPYLVSKQTVSNSANFDWPATDGTAANQGTRENNGTLTDLGGGNYKYVFAKNISTATLPVGGTAIAYDRSRVHRISMMMGGRSGPTANAHFDFVPDGSANTESRAIVPTTSCQQCHGPDFAAHGSDRITVENCVTCHNPTTSDPQSGNNLELGVMVHKIHAGREAAGAAGADGIYFDNPATTVNEAADNKAYTIWGYNNAKTVFGGEFPAVTENCTKCHTGTGANANNWKEKPARAACAACHATTSYVSPAPAGTTLHTGGALSNDSTCATCHPSSGEIVPSSFQYPIPAVHDWTKKDPRNIPEFTVDMTVSTPANAKYFVAGESPVVTMVVKNAGTPIDHTQFREGAAKGCLTTGCPAPDAGKYAASNFFVHGPRARNSPVLTMAARVKVVSAVGNCGTPEAPTTYNIGATGSAITVKVDGGETLYSQDSNKLVTTLAGTITVAVPAAGALIANPAAATCAEIANWLNANAAFKARAIAYVDNALSTTQNNRLAIRSRNKGAIFGVQLVAQADAAKDVAAIVFNDFTAKATSSSTGSNKIAAVFATGAAQDPKVTYAADKITYQLDPVDDLASGTYVANVEFGQLGRVSETNYRTPTIARVKFQVGQEVEEKPIAVSCNTCHQNADGKGFILDFARHNKPFDTNATDTCTACHDYQPQNAVGGWSGAGALARRVHGVHRGAELNFPDSGPFLGLGTTGTVGYSNGDPVAGRHWAIEFPQDIRNCQACHTDGQVSGSWSNKPSRLACGSCHDGLASQNHMRIMTWDPTPADAFSGDEGESCAACHK